MRDIKISSYANIIDRILMLIDRFLLFFLHLYLFVLDKMGSEFNLAEDMCKKLNIPFHCIDLDFDSLLKKFRKWYNPIIFILLLLLFILSFDQKFALLIVFLLSFLVAGSIYFYCFVLVTKRMRDIHFVDSTKKIINENNYSSVLVIFGKEHRKYYKKNLDVMDLT